MVLRSLTLKIVFGLLFLTIFVAAPTIFLTFQYQNEILTEHTEKEYESNAQIAAAVIEDAIEKEDLKLLVKYLKLIQEKGEFAFIAIVESEDIFICQPSTLGNIVLEENPDYNYSRVRLSSNLFKNGFLVIGSSSEQDAQVIAKLSEPISYLIMFAGLITIGLVWLINKGISKPLVMAEKIATQLGKYNYQVTIPSSNRGDEIGRLLSAFQNLKERLQFYQRETENFTQTLQSEISDATRDLENKKRYSEILFELAQQLIFADKEHENSPERVKKTIEHFSEQLDFDLVALYHSQDGIFSSKDLSLYLGLPKSFRELKNSEISKLESNKVILTNPASAQKIFGETCFTSEPKFLLLYKFQNFNGELCLILMVNQHDKKSVDLSNLTNFLELYSALYVSHERYIAYEKELLELNKNLEAKVLQKVRENLEISNNLVVLDKLATIGEMSASVAHDLNTPLGAIQASAENIEYLLGQVFNQLIGLSENEIKHLYELINRLSPEEWYANHDKSKHEVKEINKLLNQSLGQQYQTDFVELLAGVGLRKNDEQLVLEIASLPNAKRLLTLCNEIYELRTFNSAIITSVVQGTKVIQGLSKFVSEDLDQTLKALNLKKSFEVIKGLFKHRFREIDNFEIQIDSEIMVMGVEVKLFQLWSNILKNALDALAEQDRSKNDYKVIKVQAKAEEENVVIDISNNGPEIPEEIQKKIFKKFFTTKQARNGTGLGLSIVSSVIQQHRGKFELISNKDWTTFRIHLKLARDQ